MQNHKIYYSIEDNFPPYRVDVAELFGHALKKHGLDTEWYMRRGKPGGCANESFAGQQVHLPYRSARAGILSKLIDRLSFWGCDAWHLFQCLGKPVHLIQVRDKYLASILGLLVAKIKGVPFVYWCSYPFPEHYLAMANQATGLRKLYCLIHGWMGVAVLYRVVMPLSRHVFVQSDQMKRDIARFGVAEIKMMPVPMGVPSRLLHWKSAQVTEIVPGRIVYLGTMASVRHLEVMIDAFARVHDKCPQATFLMVGDGDHPHERAALERQAAQLGLSDCVRFTGFVPIEEAWTFAASASLCISPFYPSSVLNSASPTKLNEYMALGRPVVCNTHPDQTRVIDESGAGLCVEWGSENFANAMIWMLEHPEEAEAMGAKGPAWVAAHRTYPILANLVWQKYQEILAV